MFFALIQQVKRTCVLCVGVCVYVCKHLATSVNNTVNKTYKNRTHLFYFESMYVRVCVCVVARCS